MAASSQSVASGRGKRMWLIGLGLIVILAGLYTGGWFYATTMVKTTVLKALGEQKDAGISGECSDMAFSGFPFSIGLSCAKVTVDDHVKGVSASFDNLHASAPVYQPNHVGWSLRSPAEIRTAQGLTVSAEWTDLQSNLIAKGRGVAQSETVIDGLKAGIVSSFTGQSADVTAAHTEMHARQNGDDLELAIGIENANAVIKDFPQTLPTASTSADITLTGKAGLLDGSDGHGLYGAAGVLRKVVIDIGDGRVMTLSGPFNFDDQGFLSGQFKLEINQIGPWGDSLKATIPAAKNMIDTATKLLKSLAAGGDKVSVDLTADRGRLSLSGFIPLGKIPPI
ncbi:DUF2125 domain-containing protein [Rhizobium sp. LEGMi198b]|uniref:DUF2125 domain-containing protein n=1 Tax=unclassified Rhizobium TaxID=2613769 RepID=UPI000CDF2E86|nr:MULTISPECIES: DUF2125 domain-containing protein [Rhizobium]AVA23187.1 hypothetical protein NXC24_CH03573 [Rhizobium sp. NXC24]MDK4739820.1 DUF2125 domain-containing protein [Rhizobium sp. CNPSo 3464]UWU20548.1 DUF2125 domain-containing protein [Rhizobium tropici]